MGYPSAPRNKPDAINRASFEKSQQLTGERREDPQQKAVTHGDAAGLGTIRLTSAILTGAPTTADYNALVADLRAIAAVLNAMGATITWS